MKRDTPRNESEIGYNVDTPKVSAKTPKGISEPESANSPEIFRKRA